jgi:hypothetical protein
MIKFNQFFTMVTEASKSGPLKTHLSHIEDLVLEQGIEGFHKFKEQIEEFVKYLRGFDSNTDINLKVDGAPALYFGYDVRRGHEGEFFVATKSSFNTTPLINHNELDIEHNHGKSEGLQFILKQALHYLKPLYEKLAPSIGNRMVQTDFLFKSSDDRDIEEIDGTKYVTFHPQLIKYAIPVDNSSELYRSIRNAEVGIAIHDLWDIKADNNSNRIVPVTNKPKDPELVDEFASVGYNTGVFVVNSMYTKESIGLKVDDSIIQKIEDLLNDVEMEISEIPEELDSRFFVKLPEDVVDRKVTQQDLKHELKLVDLFRIFLNNEVRKAALGEKNVYQHALQGNNFNDSYFNVAIREFLHTRRVMEVTKKKSDKGKEASEQFFDILNDLKDEFKLYFKATYHLIQIKHYLTEMFDKVDTTLKIGKAFYPEGEGFKLDKGEGFVLFVGDNHVKIVDRIAFSGRNLTLGKFQKK